MFYRVLNLGNFDNIFVKMIISSLLYIWFSIESNLFYVVIKLKPYTHTGRLCCNLKCFNIHLFVFIIEFPSLKPHIIRCETQLNHSSDATDRDIFHLLTGLETKNISRSSQCTHSQFRRHKSDRFFPIELWINDFDRTLIRVVRIYHTRSRSLCIYMYAFSVCVRACVDVRAKVPNWKAWFNNAYGFEAESAHAKKMEERDTRKKMWRLLISVMMGGNWWSTAGLCVF